VHHERPHRRCTTGAALLALGRGLLGPVAAAMSTASVAARPGTAAAGAVSFGAFVTWSLIGRAWDGPVAHLPVLRGTYPAVIAATATATSAALCAALGVDGVPVADWLVVLGVAGAVAVLAREIGSAADGSHPVRIAFIGTAAGARRLGDVIDGARVSSHRLVGRVAVDGDTDGDIRVIAGLGDLRAAIVHERIDLLVVGSGVGRLLVFEALARCLDVPFQYTELSAFYEDVFGNVPTAEINAAWFAHLAAAGARHTSPVAKRMLDVGLALAIGVLTAPLLACAVVIIRLGGGPALFVQERVGEGGRTFPLYKLRTMRVGSGDQLLWTQEGDPRITRIGRLLRRTHVDELPQLWNVLRGEMSLVGPRPEQVGFVVRLEAMLPFYQRRHLIRPGITGWAQVRCGYAGSEAGSAWKLCNDLYYVKHRSLGLDVLVLIETAGTLFLGSALAERIPLTPWTAVEPPPESAPPPVPAPGVGAIALSVPADDEHTPGLVP
jgi:lipopolysaccharide/colanic/teichoic acid biosynthesis glycosyltransferase